MPTPPEPPEPPEPLEPSDPKTYTYTYRVEVSAELDQRKFSEEECRILRPIAETLAMLDGNAFFGRGDDTHYQAYLPEAYQVFESNGGLRGWAGQASWLRDLTHSHPDVREAYQNFWTLKNLMQGT